MNLSRDNLQQIIDTLQQYKRTDKHSILKEYAEKRMLESAESYNEDLHNHLEALLSHNSLKVLKKINRELK